MFRFGSGATEVTSQLVLLLFLKFLQSFGYYGLSIALTSYLTDDFGATDVQAGTIYGLLGMLTAGFSLVSGPIIDAIGMQRSLLLGGALCGVGRAALAVTTSLRVATLILCTVLPFGESFGIPVLSKAVGASCTDANRKWGYGLFYTAMNVGVLCIGPTVDSIRAMGDRGGLTPYRWLALLCAGAGFGSMVLTWLLLDGIDSNGSVGAANGSGSGGSGGSGSNRSRGTDAAGRWGDQDDSMRTRLPVATARSSSSSGSSNINSAATASGDSSVVEAGGGDSEPEPLWTPTFRRFIVMVLLLSGVRTMFRHLDATLPKYVTLTVKQPYP
jgi:MFS family permease